MSGIVYYIGNFENFALTTHAKITRSPAPSPPSAKTADTSQAPPGGSRYSEQGAPRAPTGMPDNSDCDIISSSAHTRRVYGKSTHLLRRMYICDLRFPTHRNVADNKPF